MGMHNIGVQLRDGAGFNLDADSLYKAMNLYDGSGGTVGANVGYLFVAGDTAPSATTGYAPGCLFLDVDTGAVYYNSGTVTSCTFSAIGAGSALGLDGAFDVAKVIDGAGSQANAVRIGDGTDYAGIYAVNASNAVHIEANAGSTIELDPAAASGSGTVNVNGVLVVDSTVTSTGNFAVGSNVFTVNATTGATVITGTATIDTIAGEASKAFAIAAASGQNTTYNAGTTGTIGVGTVSTGAITVGNASVTAITLTTAGTGSGTITLTGDIAATGAVTLTGALGMTGNLTVTGNLSVSGSQTWAGVLQANGGIQLNGALIAMDADDNSGFQSNADDDIDVELAGSTEFSFETTRLDMQGNHLDDCGYIILNAVTKPASGAEVYAAHDNSGDLNLNCKSGKDVIVSVNGADAIALDETGIQFAGSATVTTGATQLVLTPNTDVVVSNGHGVILGNTAQITAGNGATVSEFQIQGTALTDSSIVIGAFSADAVGPDIMFVKSRHATIASNTIVADNDEVGRLVWNPADGADFQTEAAVFQAEVDDGSPAAGDIGMAFVWEQMPGGGGGIAETMRLSAAGDLSIQNGLIVGASTQITAGAASEVQIRGTALADSSVVLAAFSADAVGPELMFVKSHNATIDTNTIVSDNDEVGRIVWYPADGTDYATEAAVFQAEVDDGSPATGDVGMAFVWESMAGGAAAIAERMRLSAAGDLSIANGGGLLVGSATGITAGALSEFQVLGTALTDASAIIGIFSADAVGGDLQFVKSRNAAIGSNTILVDNDVVGRIVFLPDDGVDFATEAAVFSAEVDDATPAAGDIGMAFVWDSMPGAAGAQREVMRLSAAGSLTVLTSVITPTITGSTAADGNLMLNSTSDATKGYVGIASGEEGLKVGGTAVRAGTVGDNVVHIYDGAAAPAGALANGISLYSAAGEGYAMDAGGNTVQITP